MAISSDSSEAATAQAPGVAPAMSLGPPGPPSCAVSVIVTTTGELDQLERSLDALVRQDLLADYDIEVIDDDAEHAEHAAHADHADSSSASAGGGTALQNATARMVALWAARAGQYRHHGVRLRYLPNPGPNHGLAAARNFGWQQARADIVAFTGDDAVAAVDWLRQGLAPFNAGVGGHAGGNDGGHNGARDHASQHPQAVFGCVDSTLPKQPTEVQFQTHLRESGEFAGCNWFCRRSLLERLHGFDERFADAGAIDTDMHFRLLEAGVPVARAPQARVAHPVPASSWGASLSQLRRLSGDALLYKKHPQLYREKIRRPPDWHDVAVVAALLLAAVGLWLHHEVLTVAAGGAWLVLTAMLCIRRLRETAKTPSHIAAVLLTSPFLPPLALFWRLVGAVRYRVRFA